MQLAFRLKATWFRLDRPFYVVYSAWPAERRWSRGVPEEGVLSALSSGVFLQDPQRRSAQNATSPVASMCQGANRAKRADKSEHQRIARLVARFDKVR